MGSELTDKQQTLCEEYIVDLDVKEAAKRANISYGYARQLLTKSNILSEISRLKCERSERTQIEADSVVKELAKVAFSNIQDYLTVGNDGEVFLKNFEHIEPENLAAVESIKISTTRNKDDSCVFTTTQFKLHSKLNALDQLGRHLGIYDRDNTQKKALNFQVIHFANTKVHIDSNACDNSSTD